MCIIKFKINVQYFVHSRNTFPELLLEAVQNLVIGKTTPKNPEKPNMTSSLRKFTDEVLLLKNFDWNKWSERNVKAALTAMSMEEIIRIMRNVHLGLGLPRNRTRYVAVNLAETYVIVQSQGQLNKLIAIYIFPQHKMSTITCKIDQILACYAYISFTSSTQFIKC